MGRGRRGQGEEGKAKDEYREGFVGCHRKRHTHAKAPVCCNRAQRREAAAILRVFDLGNEEKKKETNRPLRRELAWKGKLRYF